MSRKELMGEMVTCACSPEFGPLSSDEFRRVYVDGNPDEVKDTDEVVPLSCCWPMGSIWASFIAQSVMTGTLRLVGVASHQFLCATGPLPQPSMTSVSVATDDVIAFERVCPSSLRHGSVCPEFVKLEALWSSINLTMKRSKIVDRSLSGTALGRDLVDGKVWMPKRGRLRDLLNAIRLLFDGHTTSPSDFSHFFGVLQWVLLANRPMLSCCGSVYSFARHDDTKQQHAPTKVLRELLLIVSLMPGLVQDLRLPWSNAIYATAGAQDFGYGGVDATCSPTLTRNLASASRKDGVAFVLDGVAEGDEQDVCRVPLEFKDFQVQFSIRSRDREHACALEMGALTILIQNLARASRTHRVRTFCLVDSQSLRFVVLKGRSGAEHFRFGSRRIAALLIATEIQLHLGYTPSRSNPGDPPSRGLGLGSTHRRNAATKASRVAQRHIDYLDGLSRSYRRCIRCGTAPSWWQASWASSHSSSDLGQPSVGSRL